VFDIFSGSALLQGTNTYLIGQGSSRILVDAGEDITAEAYVPHLISVMRDAGVVSLSAILLTHGHHDHQGGVPYLLEKLKKQFPDQRLPVVYKRTIGAGLWDSGNYPAKGFEAQHIRDGEEFRTQGATLKAVYTPGHTDDHVAFCLIEDKAILTGDCVLGCGTTVFDDLTTYMESLHKLKAMFIGTQFKHIYPGQ
jgi:glyoxylase-like metal-dependent hydrolase (beta-lactamase superfamily II)